MKTNKPRIIIDTNVILVSVLIHHKFFWINEALVSEKYTLLVSNEIIEEYEEKLIEKFGVHRAQKVLDALMDQINVERISPIYRWLLIKDDPDDDKFVDCAVAGNADFIVTHDKHFNILKEIPFPKVETVTIPEFKEILEKFERGNFE